MCVRQAPSLYMIHSSKIKEKQQLEREVHKRTLEREREKPQVVIMLLSLSDSTAL